MQIEISLTSSWGDKAGAPASAVALGYFDGMHTAHREVIKAVVSAKSEGLCATVLTFWGGKGDAGAILSREQKLAELEAMGVDRVIIPPFAEIAELDANVFFERCLISGCKAKIISVGYDYRFGKGAKGDVSLLKSLCDRHGIRLNITKQRLQSSETISSSRIRVLLAAGEVETANRMLGYDYYTKGKVISGNRIGATIGFPTINQAFEENQLVPRFGVYSTTAWIDGIPFKSITNIGVKPTVSPDNPPTIETHILDFNGDLYGRDIKISYHRMLRDEKRFYSVEELKAQIALDVSFR